MFFELAAFWVFCFFVRAFPRMHLKKVNNSDTYFHLFLINYIRDNGVQEMLETKRFTRPFSLQYPWMLHWLLSYLPKEGVGYAERFFNPFWDSFFALIFVLLGLALGVPLEHAVLGGLIYLLTPLSFGNLGTGPRVITFTPRLFGEVIGGGVFLLEYLYFKTDQSFYLIIATILASSLFLMSKFSAQALILISVFLSILMLRVEPVLLVLSSFLICIVYSKGFYLKVLREHYGQLRSYFREVMADRIALSERNNLKVMLSVIRSGNLKRILVHFMVYNSFFIALYKSPIVFIALWLAWESGDRGLEFTFLLSGVIVFLIVSLKWFLFIGEAERYLNYLLLFPILILVFHISEYIWLAYGLIAYGVVYFVIDYYLVYLKSSKFGGDINDKFIDYLNNVPQELRFATLPHHLGCWRIVYETKHHWWGPTLFPISKEDDEKNKKYWLKNPYLDLSKIVEFMDDFQLDCVFIDTARYQSEIGDVIYPDKTKHKDIGNGIVMVTHDREI